MAKKNFSLVMDLPHSPCFLLAFPCPLTDQIDVAQTEIWGEIISEGESYPVKRGDFFKYNLQHLSPIICQLAYGHSPDWVRTHLKQKYPYLRDDSYVAFFLFTHIMPI